MRIRETVDVERLRGLRLLELVGLLNLDLRVEERAHDLLANLGVQLLEHPVPLPRVLDQGILLCHRAQVHAFSQVVHVLEVLAPAVVDDLQDHEPLDVTQQRLRRLRIQPEALLPLRIGVPRVLLELLDERDAVEPALLAQLVRRDRLLGRVEVDHRAAERVEIPLLVELAARVLVDRPLDHLVDPEPNLLREVLPLEHAAPLLVDHGALLVHHVVVLEHVLAHDEVLLLDLLLRVLDLVREDLRLHGLVVRHLEALHDVVDPVTREQAHEVVLAGEVEARLAGVALAARAPSELVVDPARLVALSAEHVQAAELLDPVGELDVDAAAGHVGRDRDRALLARLGDDPGLLLVLLRVENVVRDAGAIEELREVLGDLDRDRSDEHRLADRVALLDVCDHRVVLRVRRLEDHVVLVVARDVDVGRDLDHVQVVDLDELLLLGLGRAGHPRELLVETEVVLQRDRGERLVLLLNADALLGLDRLVEPLRPAAAFHDPARELVDDLDLAVLDDVVDVALEERLRLQRLIEVGGELPVARVVEVVDLERALDRLDRALHRRDRLVLLVVLEVGAGGLGRALRLAGLGCEALERLGDAREVVVDLRRGLGLTGDDQRCARLVDQDRVDLVHDREVVAALDDAVERDGHVVAQVVEAELGVRAVDDVGRVRLAPLVEGHHVRDEGGPHSEGVPDRLRPLGVALGQVVVDRDQVDARAGERIQVERLHGDERLALAGLHLGDVALVQDDAAHLLDVEEADAHGALERLADGGEGLEDELVDRLAVLDPLFELGCLAGQLGVAQSLELGLERGNVGGLLGQPLDAPALAEAQDFFEGSELLSHRPRGAALQRVGLDLPGLAVQAAGAHDVVLALGAADSLQLGDAPEGARPVDGEGPAGLAGDQLELVAVGTEAHHGDAAGCDGPDVLVLPDGFGPVGRFEGLLDRVGERRERVRRLVFVHDQVAVREGDEVDLVPGQPGRFGRGDRIPAARAGHAVDAGHAPVRAGVDGASLRLLLEPRLTRQLLVQRLAPEDHWGSIS